MKAIKFRAWDKDRKIMFGVQEIEFDYKNMLPIKISVFEFGKDWGFETSDAKSNKLLEKWYTLMQFTCLLDKNKKEIYEGDIVKIGKTQYPSLGEEIIEVKWLEGTTGFFPFRNYSYIQDYMEIIGNIYENPELLKS